MDESFTDRKIFSLLDVTRSIQRTITERYSSSFWVKAEMIKLNHYSHSGHCYPDLVQKIEGKVVAQMRSSLWKDDYRRINRRFTEVLKEPLKDGINILFMASIHFDPVHGLGLRIIDIDPVYSLGELEREKLESIAKLSAEGIFNQNRKTFLAVVPQRIAVISVETSKGYSDYLKVVEENPWGYKFFNLLFPSLLQGEKSVKSILNQLRRIRKVIHHFDAVAIIRGGGGDVGLSSFNDYELAREVALFPIPVITGIGHSTNETVVEMVSFKNAITPTELADFLIQKFHDFSVPVRKAEEIIGDRSKRLIKDENLRLQNTARFFQSVTHNNLLHNRHMLNVHSKVVNQESRFILRRASEVLAQTSAELKAAVAQLLQQSQTFIADQSSELCTQCNDMLLTRRQSVDTMQANVRMLDPINILKRGFTITLDENGKAVKDVGELQPLRTLTTIFANGSVESKIETINPAESHE